MSELVSYKNNGSISIITLDDGKANSLSPTMIHAINKALDQAENDKATIILTGREGKFCAGFDLSVFQQGGDALAEMLSGGAKLAERLMRYPHPVVIASNGHALAMGALLLLAADYRIGAQGAFKIGLNEVAIGMIMPAFGTEIARYALTSQFFKRSLINAEIYTPEQAVQSGFFDETVPLENLQAHAQQKAQDLAKLNPGAFKGTKLGARKDALAALRAAIEKDFGA